MPKIRQLPLHEAQKIAAGEVVDRPANVVKELIENALDAGATQITIYLEQAGKKQIRIVDNGCGMSPEDAHLCFEQYATSKIQSVQELNQVATFGFRGEALASIAAVSIVTLITKEEHDEHGVKLVRKHGAPVHEEVIACTTGTDITIQDLFGNIPARKKFLKTDDTEWRAVLPVIQAFCMAYPQVHFKIFHDDKQVFNCHATDTLLQRATQLWDHTLAQSLIALPEITDPNTSITVHGIISHHHYSRYDRNHIFLFVNKRWIKNYQLVSALIKGYLNVLPQGRYPAAGIFITIDPQQVDINIHPRKEEIQFLHPLKVASLIQERIKKTLEQHLSRQLQKTSTPESPYIVSSYAHPHSAPNARPEGTSFGIPAQAISPFFSPSFELVSQDVAKSSLPLTLNDQTKISGSTPAASHIQEVDFAPYKIIGQYHKTYILIEQETGLFIVDQHAAHERILYELFSQRFDDVATVKLLFPQLIRITSAEAHLIEHNYALFKQHGIELERFSDDQISVYAIPVYLKEANLDDIIKQIVVWLVEDNDMSGTMHPTKLTHEKIHAQMACKAAVKAGDELSHEKMVQLLQDLAKTANQFTCPHGRPTGWLLSLSEMEKKFKRRQ
jgi:DNA mismatch repair protein MutL